MDGKGLAPFVPPSWHGFAEARTATVDSSISGTKRAWPFSYHVGGTGLQGGFSFNGGVPIRK